MIWWRVPCGGRVLVPDATELRHLPPHAAQAARLFMEGRGGILILAEGAGFEPARLVT